MLNEKINDLYSIPDVIRVIKSRRMEWVEHVVSMWYAMGEDKSIQGLAGET
jgi:hypothetical protein